MNISFVLDTFGGGGKERRCLQLIQGLNRMGYTELQVIIINDTVDYPELYRTSAEIHIIDRKKKGLSFFATSKSVQSLFNEFHPDIVQTWGGISTLIPVLLKPFFRYKLIGAYVADTNKQSYFSLTTLFNIRCDKVVGNSKIGLKAYHVPDKKAVLIYNGFNETRLENNIEVLSKKKSLNVSTPYVVAMIAMFWWHKDWPCFLRTAQSIIKERQDITFLAVGKGPTWEECNNSIKDNERELIKLIGGRKDVDEILQICDVTVLVSNHGEGVSNAILESMAFGVPVIATNAGGTPEIIKDSENGILLNKNDEMLLKNAILKLIDNEELRDSFSKACSNTVRVQFNLDKMTQRYLDLYIDMI